MANAQVFFEGVGIFARHVANIASRLAALDRVRVSKVPLGVVEKCKSLTAAQAFPTLFAHLDHTGTRILEQGKPGAQII